MRLPGCGAINTTNTPILREKTMHNYILFENALQMLVNAFLASAMFMIAASGIGLAVIETLEKSSDTILRRRGFANEDGCS